MLTVKQGASCCTDYRKTRQTIHRKIISIVLFKLAPARAPIETLTEVIDF